MHSGLSSFGVSCSSISEVSNNGGKYDRRISALNTGCKPRKGGMLSLKSLSPTSLVMVYNLLALEVVLRLLKSKPNTS
jgi:hypothetical protein